MNPFSLLLLLLLSSTLPSFLQALDLNPNFIHCASFSFPCGHRNFNISYPFLVADRPLECGDPKYRLTCDPAAGLTIFINSIVYQVIDIDYPNNLLTIIDSQIAGESCPQPFTNATALDFSLFDYADSVRNLTLYINCSGSSIGLPMIYEIACLTEMYGKHSYYRLENGTGTGGEFFGKCASTVLVPMNRTMADMLVSGSGNVSFTGAVQAGFAVRWLAGAEWCGGCAASGGLCGHYYSSPQEHTCFCANATAVDSCNPVDGDHSGRIRKKIIIGVCAGVGGFLLACALCFLFYKCKRRQERSSSLDSLIEPSYTDSATRRDPELGSPTYPTHFFSYQELQEATEGFNASKELGDGGYGAVYKGSLRDGRTVAIKRLYDNNYKRVEQYINEVKILSCLRHQNLVTLYGCTSPRTRELLLVYEYLPNGTIADHLHGRRAHEGNLSWPVRMTIAIETADALAYLHAVEPPIIHRDVKTNNILLDSSFHAKVADFGLSRFFPTDATHVSTAPQGTPGYVDPEYHQCYQLTNKSDVYSFGVVLVELISSKPAVDLSRPKSEINLANMAIHVIQSCELDRLVDPRLGCQSDARVQMMVAQVAELAFRCLQGDREMRPTVKEVLEALRGIESGVCKEKVAEEPNEKQTVKTTEPFSPDSVVDKWASRESTPNVSG